MLHLHSSQKLYENHQLILDHLDQQDIEDHVKSNISSSTNISTEPQFGIQHFRVIKDGRHYDEGFRVSSSDKTQMDSLHHQHPTKTLKIISSEEPTSSSSSMPDLGKSHEKYPAISD